MKRWQEGVRSLILTGPAHSVVIKNVLSLINIRFSLYTPHDISAALRFRGVLGDGSKGVLGKRFSKHRLSMHPKGMFKSWALMSRSSCVGIPLIDTCSLVMPVR